MVCSVLLQITWSKTDSSRSQSLLKWAGLAVLVGFVAYHRFRIMLALAIGGPGGEPAEPAPAV